MQLAFFSAKESKLIASMTVHQLLEQPFRVKKVKNVNIGIFFFNSDFKIFVSLYLSATTRLRDGVPNPL